MEGNGQNEREHGSSGVQIGVRGLVLLQVNDDVLVVISSRVGYSAIRHCVIIEVWGSVV